MEASSPLFCTHCGAANRQQAAFCFACGKPLQDDHITSPGSAGLSTDASEGLLSRSSLKDRYLIAGQLGKGGMGAVYKAEDTLFNHRLVAIKEMSQGGLNAQQRADAAADFKREAHMLANLEHAGLPAIYDYFSEEGQWYLVMDFIAGETLEDYLTHTPGGWLPLIEALDIGKQLCNVLAYLHERQPPIIFRDLKPSNVMITPEGKVFLIDFGIARHFKPGQLRDTVSFGSAGYAAPEQYGKTQTTPRSDIYSLGVILHQCLSGNDPANNSPTPFDFPALDMHGQVAPARLATLIHEMLTMNPAGRPDNMSLVWQELHHMTRQLNALPQVKPSRSTPLPPPVPGTSPVTKPEQVVVPMRTMQPPIPQPIAAQAATPSVQRTSTLTYETIHLYTSSVQAMACAPDRSRIVTGGSDGQIQLWGIEEKLQPVRSYQFHQFHTNVIQVIAWSPGSTYITSGDASGLLLIWEAASGKRVYSYRGYSIAITGIAWSPDGRRIATGDSRGRVLVQDALNGDHAYAFTGSDHKACAITWSPDGKTIATGGETGQVQVYDANSRALVYTCNEHTAGITTLAYSPDGCFLAAGDSNGTAYVWKTGEKENVCTYRGHEAAVTALAWSSDSQRIVSGGHDRTAQVWEPTAGGKHIVTYQEHTEHITALLWLADGKRVVSASKDRTLRIWRTY